ncbi:Aspartate-semialdehyde dehydrogenase [Capsicum annuum]|nr:Aspartate-semialdehyde dehydrogenase [Capsicum annuum]
MNSTALSLRHHNHFLHGGGGGGGAASSVITPLRSVSPFRIRMSLNENAPSIAVVGVTGAVGQEFLSVLTDRDFPYRSLKLLASKRSAGKTVKFENRNYTVEELNEESFDGIDIALFSAGGSISKKYGPVAAKKGTIVVDNSSAFRMDENVPLVIPEVNPEAMVNLKVGCGKGGIIANPNCSTIICLMAVTPLHRRAKVRVRFLVLFHNVSYCSTIIFLTVVTPLHRRAKVRVGFFELSDTLPPPSQPLPPRRCRRRILRHHSAALRRSIPHPHALNENAPSIAVVGVTGAVGQEFLSVLTDRNFPYRSLKLLASKRSAGKTVKFENRNYTVEELNEESFDSIDIALFSAGGSISKKYGPVAAKKGTIVVDNSLAFRMDENVRLVIPEVNPKAMASLRAPQLNSRDTCYLPPATGSNRYQVTLSTKFRTDGKKTPSVCLCWKLNLIPHGAHPNFIEPLGHTLGEYNVWMEFPVLFHNVSYCFICLTVVTPLHRRAKVKRMVVSTYQAASGAGAAAMEELVQQTREVLDGKEPTCNIFNQQYAFNLFSHNAPIQPNGYNEEEMKLVKETRKIWSDMGVKVTATCIRVPVMRAHAESVNLQFEKPLDEDTARNILKNAPGIVVVDDRASNRFPTPLEVSNKDDVAVGRVRRDVSQDGDYGLDIFVCGDQIRKGAALNAVQIAEMLL